MGNRDLEYYRHVLEAIDREVTHSTGLDAEEILSSDAYDLLVARDKLAEDPLTAVERDELERLDKLLLRHRQLVIQNVDPDVSRPAERWWWHLHEGPQVRARARKVA
jgi:hypothetical protein